ncbi:YuzB family protein [Saliterribacillus persicus]|uniref:Uncharacterized protein YuzB (UPF0349 family) n=1 Tax=Saliterribacillus persicus TaxID=930114 RepID=A0A368XG50_9BACI|nr:YuzB family protein [Saliterribacillus persicus]RCW66943.1 uncharacterized protein YuzB (UPF0349 family) [Saliterribacillus persicus]
MDAIIEFCINNLASGSESARKELASDPDLDVIEYGCTSNCGLCANFLFAVVNGTVVRADTSAELVENIYDYIDEHPLTL